MAQTSKHRFLQSVLLLIWITLVASEFTVLVESQVCLALALAEYDKTANGGNVDGVITQTDAVFSRLRLWQDTNHNGLAETFELQTLGALGINILELDYKESKRADEHGNQFRYRAKVKNNRGQQMGRWAWDVFLVKSP